MFHKTRVKTQHLQRNCVQINLSLAFITSKAIVKCPSLLPFNKCKWLFVHSCTHHFNASYWKLWINEIYSTADRPVIFQYFYLDITKLLGTNSVLTSQKWHISTSNLLQLNWRVNFSISLTVCLASSFFGSYSHSQMFSILLLPMSTRNLVLLWSFYIAQQKRWRIELNLDR